MLESFASSLGCNHQKIQRVIESKRQLLDAVRHYLWQIKKNLDSNKLHIIAGFINKTINNYLELKQKDNKISSDDLLNGKKYASEFLHKFQLKFEVLQRLEALDKKDAEKGLTQDGINARKEQICKSHEEWAQKFNNDIADNLHAKTLLYE